MISSLCCCSHGPYDIVRYNSSGSLVWRKLSLESIDDIPSADLPSGATSINAFSVNQIETANSGGVMASGYVRFNSAANPFYVYLTLFNASGVRQWMRVLQIASLGSTVALRSCGGTTLLAVPTDTTPVYAIDESDGSTDWTQDTYEISSTTVWDGGDTRGFLWDGTNAYIYGKQYSSGSNSGIEIDLSDGSITAECFKETGSNENVNHIVDAAVCSNGDYILLSPESGLTDFTLARMTDDQDTVAWSLKGFMFTDDWCYSGYTGGTGWTASWVRCFPNPNDDDEVIVLGSGGFTDAEKQDFNSGVSIDGSSVAHPDYSPCDGNDISAEWIADVTALRQLSYGASSVSTNSPLMRRDCLTSADKIARGLPWQDETSSNYINGEDWLHGEDNDQDGNAMIAPLATDADVFSIGGDPPGFSTMSYDPNPEATEVISLSPDSNGGVFASINRVNAGSTW